MSLATVKWGKGGANEDEIRSVEGPSLDLAEEVES